MMMLWWMMGCMMRPGTSAMLRRRREWDRIKADGVLQSRISVFVVTDTAQSSVLD
jgi:hypothetical protein